MIDSAFQNTYNIAVSEARFTAAVSAPVLPVTSPLPSSLSRAVAIRHSHTQSHTQAHTHSHSACSHCSPHTEMSVTNVQTVHTSSHTHTHTVEGFIYTHAPVPKVVFDFPCKGCPVNEHTEKHIEITGCIYDKGHMGLAVIGIPFTTLFSVINPVYNL